MAGRLRVVVVGAGFGGLNLVRALRHAPVDITLLDQHNYHLFTPLLYQVASAVLDPSEIARPVRAILRGQHNATFVLGRCVAVDTTAHRVETSSGPLPYDRVVLATGSVNDFFGNPGIAERAYGLKELGDALALRNHVLATFEHASVVDEPEERRRLQTIAVVGAGPTGVECSGAFRELAALVLRRDFRDSALRDVDIELIEAAPQLLGTFAPSLQRAATRTLQKRGVHVHLGVGVRDVERDAVTLQDGTELSAGTVVWTAGVRASPAGELLGVDLTRAGRVPVDAWMRVHGLTDVYAIGDLAAVDAPAGPHPMLAPVAIQQGRHVARQIDADAHGRPPIAAFGYVDKGTMATIGRNAAVAQIGPVRLHGLLGWLTWLFVHLVQIIGFRNRVIVLLNWAWDYFLRDRPVRLITSAKHRDDEPDG